MLGKEILGYHVDEKIGSGGYGIVYKVSKTNVTGTYVRALKHIEFPTKKQYAAILNSMGGNSVKADDYFANILSNIIGEIKIFSVLSESGNPNIVRYYENDVVESISPKKYDIYILMEYLTPLPDYLDNNSLTFNDVIKLGKDILNALITCNKRNIIHRDIKDANIFVSADGTYKIGDFGVSKSLKDQSRAASIKGTPNFIAPEVYLGKENYDRTVDLYSLGIVLYRLLNNLRNPFLPAFPNAYTGEDEDAAFEARMAGKIPELPNMAKNELGEAVLKAIKPRNERYNTPEEFLEALEEAENALPLAYLSQSISAFDAAAHAESVTVNDASNISDDLSEEKNSSDTIVDSSFETIGIFDEDDEGSNEPEDADMGENHTDETIAAQSPFTVSQEFYDVTERQDFPPNFDRADQNEEKEKKKKRFLPLILIFGIISIILLISAVVFIGAFMNRGVTTVNFKTLEVSGSNAYGSVSNNTARFSFADEIKVGKNEKYKICKNANGTQTVDETVDLAYGDNYFYMYEAKKNGKKLYTINIRRRPLYNVVFNIDSENSVSYQVEESMLIQAPESPKKTGYNFAGWNYDFTIPVKQDTVIEPIFTVMQFTVTWKDNIGCSIAVKRTESPYASASRGKLKSGDSIYYGDKLSIEYIANTGYSLSEIGATSIMMVHGNVTSSQIYAVTSLKEYTVTWSSPSGCSITVKRTSSPYASASTGTLWNGAKIYYGDLLDVEYTESTGYSLSSKGATSITVTGNVTSSQIYADVSVNGYTATWNAPSGCSITVKRTSSPYASASIGTLSSGSKVYYGDMLAVEYTENTGYSLGNTGATSIRVTGNVTSAHIYANATADEYTYNVVYKSTNGTNLGSSSATYKYGTTNTISAPEKSGYDTPDSQSVAWDSASKTIIFTYTPTSVGTQTLIDNLWWWHNGSGDRGIKYTVKVDIISRTADTAKVKITWTNSIYKSYYGYIQYFKMKIGSNSTAKTEIANQRAWPQSGGETTGSKSAEVELTITGLSTERTELNYSATTSVYDPNGDNPKHPGTISGKVIIPAY